MGKNKKIRNWKARQVVEGVIDDRETIKLAEKVVIEDAQVCIISQVVDLIIVCITGIFLDCELSSGE